MDGNILDETTYKVNRAGFVIHSAIHMARRDLHCVLHTHTVPGQAVSALDCGLLPLNQAAMRFYNHIGYHDFEGIADDLDERERIVADLGDHKCMIMRNHGLLTAGADCGEAWHLIITSCARANAVVVLGSGQPYSTPPREICEKTAAQYWRSGRRLGDLDWPAQMKLLDATIPRTAINLLTGLFFSTIRGHRAFKALHTVSSDGLRRPGVQHIGMWMTSSPAAG